MPDDNVTPIGVRGADRTAAAGPYHPGSEPCQTANEWRVVSRNSETGQIGKTHSHPDEAAARRHKRELDAYWTERGAPVDVAVEVRHVTPWEAA